ncbi:MAG: carboxypeptidase-like regulatory domain-containing protein [Sulfolobales archaeon]|nr:carboxypeptidase-like regulatory domain-containing protein [Sulfolobales archaeon]MCX8198541.1 carboxypeptidase-like regulatory domain-containing protein [Sulfolobales archaeon]MDW8169614.1 carboxypeptidase regulatory-like domain-containing protein [Desulfurococcaceae archaeon]
MADALINFLRAMDQEGTSLVFLDSWGAYYHFAGYVLYKYSEAISKYGYPSPAYRSEGYMEGLMIHAPDPGSDLFSGITFDEGHRFYIASPPLDRVDYAAYQSFYQPAVGGLSYLGEIVYGGTVYGYSIVVWSKGPKEDCWVFMSVGGSYHWAKYMEKGQDMKYSHNMRRLLFNAVRHSVGIMDVKDVDLRWMNLSVMQFNWPTISAFTELNIVLERRPYGWLAGKVTAGDTGQPVNEAEVSIVGTPVKVFTNKTGAFMLWLPEGVFRVRIDARGYYSVDHVVEISVGETSYLEETLIRKPRAAVMIDFSGQITMLLLSRGWYAHAYRDWSAL